MFNTHYPSKNSCERHKMSEIVGSYVAEQRMPGSEVVLMGDFNDGVNGDGSQNTSYSRVLQVTGFRNAYADIHPMDGSSEFTSETNGWKKDYRHGRMIDPVLISPGLRVADAYVDKTMFTASGEVVDCPTVTNGRCGNGMPVNSLRMYSDHWASWAVLSQ